MQIKYQNVNYTYNLATPFKTDALKNVNLILDNHDFTMIVGRTGSGKSTLATLINYLSTPTSGKVIVNDFVNAPKKRHKHKEIQDLRKGIGFLFQFSEKQLFAETVIKDVVFGLDNFYPKNKDNLTKTKQALNLVGLDESFYNRSPLDLSGGEKKRVAIAGVIAYQPKLLILDEPTAGLDNQGKRELMSLLKKIKDSGVAIILITHDMDIVLEYADKIIVLDDGVIKKVANRHEFFSEDISQYHLLTPKVISFAKLLIKRGLNINLSNIHDIDSLVKEIKSHG